VERIRGKKLRSIRQEKATLSGTHGDVDGIIAKRNKCSGINLRLAKSK
jgi:hypothetical protein